MVAACMCMHEHDCLHPNEILPVQEEDGEKKEAGTFRAERQGLIKLEG